MHSQVVYRTCSILVKAVHHNAQIVHIQACGALIHTCVAVLWQDGKECWDAFKKSVKITYKREKIYVISFFCNFCDKSQNTPAVIPCCISRLDILIHILIAGIYFWPKWKRKQTLRLQSYNGIFVIVVLTFQPQKYTFSTQTTTKKKYLVCLNLQYNRIKINIQVSR